MDKFEVLQALQDMIGYARELADSGDCGSYNADEQPVVAKAIAVVAKATKATEEYTSERWTCVVCSAYSPRIFESGGLRRCGECHRADRRKG